MPAKVFMTVGKLTAGMKRFMIRQAWGQDAGHAVAGLPGRMLEDGDLTCIYEYMQWQFCMPGVKMCKAAVVKIATHFGGESPAGNLAVQEILDGMKQADVMVLPVHSDAPLHWTFLVLKVDSGSIVEVEYVDWLQNIAVNRKSAEKLLYMLCLQAGGKITMQLPAAKNYYVQQGGSNDCGLAMWQVLENACREKRGEGACGVYPNPKQWRKTLKSLLDALVKEQDKWTQEENLLEKVKHAIIIPGGIVDPVAKPTLKIYRKDFFTCSSCRWSLTGQGCVYCNPGKMEALRLEKERKAKELGEALQKALKKCEELGILPKPADVEESGEKLEGGGDG
jgi:hypothetical protein